MTKSSLASYAAVRRLIVAMMGKRGGAGLFSIFDLAELEGSSAFYGASAYEPGCESLSR